MNVQQDSDEDDGLEDISGVDPMDLDDVDDMSETTSVVSAEKAGGTPWPTQTENETNDQTKGRRSVFDRLEPSTSQTGEGVDGDGFVTVKHKGKGKTSAKAPTPAAETGRTRNEATPGTSGNQNRQRPDKNNRKVIITSNDGASYGAMAKSGFDWNAWLLRVHKGPGKQGLDVKAYREVQLTWALVVGKEIDEKRSCW